MTNAFREKSRNAYILFYDRSNYDFELKEATSKQEETMGLARLASRKESHLKIKNFIVEDLAPQIRKAYELVKEENFSFWRNKHTFSKEYFVFLNEMLKNEIPIN